LHQKVVLGKKVFVRWFVLSVLFFHISTGIISVSNIGGTVLYDFYFLCGIDLIFL